MKTTEKTPLPPKQPYLSVVVAARNDDHGGNMLHRMQVFVNGLAYQCRKYDLSAELIVVEWNPIHNRKRLFRVITWPKPLEPLVVRFIEVPNKVHRQIENSDKMPFFQLIAKNAGIRRARSEFVLATNVDILFSDELIRFIADKALDPDCFYRVDRYDVGKNVIPLDISFEEQLAFCNENVVMIHGRDGTRMTEQDDMHDEFKIHDNTCGDFTLMAKDKWFSLKGYPELPLYSGHIDSLNVHMAHARGLMQVIRLSPQIIYHIEHELSWAVTQESSEKYSSLDWGTDVMPYIDQMREQGRPIDFNDDDWGLAKEPLKGYAIAGRAGIVTQDIPADSGLSEDDKPIRKTKQGKLKKVSDATQPMTIFTIPKAFKDHAGVIQRNALKSWTLLEPRPEIILFGDDEGTKNIARELGLRHIPDIKRNEFGTPLMNDIFLQAQNAAKNDTLVYVNADIILMSDFMASVHKARMQFNRFLMIGQRWNADISSPLKGTARSWENRLRKLVLRSGRLEDITAIAYFVFSRDLLPGFPPFAIGRAAWDNWIIYTALAAAHPVIDATQSVMAVHQNHDYSHAKKVLFDIEVGRNRYLAFDTFFLCFISHSTWALTPAGFIQRPLQTKLFSLCSEGVNLLQGGRHDQALGNFDEVVRITFPFPGLYYARYCALAQLSQKDEAREALTYELHLFPFNERARVLLRQMNPPNLKSDQKEKQVKRLSKKKDVISDIREYLTL